MSASLLALPATALYFASGLLIGLRLFGPPDARRPPRALAIGLGMLAAALHAVLIWTQTLTDTGLNVAFFSVASLVAWAIAVLVLTSSLNKPVENLGIVLLPLAGLAVLLAWRHPGYKLLPDSTPWALRAHVLVSLLAYAILTVASVQAILLAIQDRHLHRRQPVGFVRALPPLQTMESLLFEMIALGFLLLSVALGTGFMFLEDMFAQHLAHKTILSVAAWTVFGILLWGRFRFGWRGRTALRWTLAGFVVLMIAYFGSKFVLELILQRG
jgi:ABC-type uncharacterized transport system permease subunit